MPLTLLLDLGRQPVSNCYVRSGDEAPTKQLLLGQCDGCGLLQLCNPFTEVDLFTFVPKWIRYREPEDHLDQLTSILCQRLGNHGGPVAGLTYIDTPVLDRLRERGYVTHSLDLVNAPKDAHCGIETMLHQVQQGHWTPGGREFDLVVARHVLDHARDLPSFLAFVASCLSAGGMVVFEVPDSAVFLEAKDYLMLWESHANYFTKATLERVLSVNGFEVRFSQRFTSAAGAVLIAICAKSIPDKVVPTSEPDASDVHQIASFVQGFPEARDACTARLREIKRKHRVVALFGAGHLGSLFVNIFGLRSFVDFAVDDDPNKSGLALPGSNLSILPTDAICDRDVCFVLLAANLASEDALAVRLQQKRSGLRLGSIYVKSPLSLLRLGEASPRE